MRIITAILFVLIAFTASTQTVINYGDTIILNKGFKEYRAAVVASNKTIGVIHELGNTIDSLVWNWDSDGVFALRCQSHNCFPFFNTIAFIQPNNLWSFTPSWMTIGQDDDWVLFVKAYDQYGQPANDIGFWIDVKVYD